MTIKRKLVAFSLTTIIIMSVILLSLMINIKSAFAQTENVIVYKTEDIDDFIKDNQSVDSLEVISDFEGNTFKLYELNPDGYAIYSIKGQSSIFIEGSYHTHSPFFTFSQNQKYYGGPGEYYIIDETGIKDIINDRYISIENSVTEYSVDPSFYEVQTIEPYATFPSNPVPGKTTTDTSGFTVIKDHQYFRNLSQFPHNIVGTCGTVAICILLGYLDEYVDPMFIYLPDHKKGNGTTQALHDFLWYYCRHTIAGYGNDAEGYPMGGYELKETMKDYIDKYCGILLSGTVEHDYGALLFTHSNPRKHINAGLPTLLVLSKFEYNNTTAPEGTQEKFHTAVAYGYDSNDRFLVHAGWEHGETTYTQTIISNATIHSYYTLVYQA